MANYTSKDIIERLEFIQNKVLEQSEKDKIEHWEKCRKLATTVHTEGWPVAVELLQSYVIHAVERLATIDPAEKENVAAQHSVMYVASQLLNIFNQDVQRMVHTSRETPEPVKEVLQSQLEL
jgi:hypothetical protein